MCIWVHPLLNYALKEAFKLLNLFYFWNCGDNETETVLQGQVWASVCEYHGARTGKTQL